MKNYLVIGGSSGIGKELSKIIAEEGGNVFATYNTNPAENSENIHYSKLDVLADDLDLDFLPEELDGFAYCAGSINLKPFRTFSPEDFIEDYKLQVTGAVKILKVIEGKLKKAGNSSIVFFSTVAVQSGYKFHSQVSASKGAIEGLTRALAAEYAPNIRVNAVAPSLTDTPLAGRMLNTDQKKEANAKRHPLNRIGDPKDIAEMAAFLLSEKSSWISGQIIHVDGGMSGIRI